MTNDNDSPRKQGYKHAIPDDLFDRICNTPRIRRSQDLRKVFIELRQRALTEADVTKLLGRSGSERLVCLHLREALEYYFCHTRAGVREKLQVSLPMADPSLGEQSDYSGRRPRLYHLETGALVHPLAGPAGFWQPHLLVGENRTTQPPEPVRNGNAIVFTEPMVFRDTENRYFIRHLDVNEIDNHPSTDVNFYVSALKKKVRWINQKNMVLSRGYVPGGEALAKDRIAGCLMHHAERIGRIGGIGTHADDLCKEVVSRHLQKSNDPKIEGHHRILLGSARTNALIREFQRRAVWAPWKIEDNGIRIQCSAADLDHIEVRIHELLGDYAETRRSAKKDAVKRMIKRQKGGALLSEDWRTLSFALVSREIGLRSSTTITTICANQGRSIQELGEKILTTNKGVLEIRNGFRISGWFPQAFQMLFAMKLTDEESRCSDWKPLLYVPLHDATKRPPELKGLNWPRSRFKAAKAESGHIEPVAAEESPQI